MIAGLIIGGGVAQLVRSDESFPDPEVTLSAGRVWSRHAVEEWAKATGRPFLSDPQSVALEGIDKAKATRRPRTGPTE